MALDRHANLFVRDVGKAAVLKVTARGEVSVFAEEVGSVKLCLPNFPVFDADGNLYVTNSTDHPLGGMEDVAAEIRNPVPKGALVRLRADGRGDIAATGLYFANGAAIDPREEYVYILQSIRNNCVRIAMRKDGTHGQPETYGENLGGLPDGMAFDAEGYLIVTLPMNNRLVVLDPAGKLSTLVDDREGKTLLAPTNCAFGGPNFDDLFIAHIEADRLSKIHVSTQGPSPLRSEIKIPRAVRAAREGVESERTVFEACIVWKGSLPKSRVQLGGGAADYCDQNGEEKFKGAYLLCANHC